MKINKLWIVILMVAGQVTTTFSQSVVVNKIYNATSTADGDADAIELLVIQDHLDMRGLILKDLSFPDADTDGGGKYKFNAIDLWKDLRSGTTIVLRRLRSADIGYTEDTDASDYKIDVILTSTLANSPYLTPIQANVGGQHFNITNNDIVMIKTDDGTANGVGVGGTIHAFATGNSNTSTYYATLQAANVPILYSADITGTGFFQYPSNPTKTLADYSGTKGAVSSSSNRGFGVGFGQNNIDYIASLRTIFVISPPTLLSAVFPTTTSLKLSWIDNSTNETGFGIEKSLDGINFTQLVTVAANVSTYTETGISQTQTSYYRVRALNALGNSTYSNIFSTASVASAPVVINKIYNATSDFNGDADAIELLVIKDHYDMRGLIVKDLSLPDADKDTGGKYKFNNIDLWKDLRSGTTIVLRRLRSEETGYVEDIDPSDFKIDVLLTSSLATSTYLTPLQANIAGQHFNITANDIVIIKTDDNLPGRIGVAGAIHAFAIGNSNTSTFYTDLQAAGVPILYVATGSGTNSFQYPLNPDKAVSDYSGAKASSSTVTNKGFGIGFGQNNIDYIEYLRNLAKFPPPSNLVAQVLALNEVGLTWVDQTTTEDNFQIERSLDGTTYTPLATLTKNTVSYRDQTVTVGTTYYYRIRAVEGTKFTPYSNVANVVAGKGIITAVNFVPVTLFENQAVSTPAGNFSITSPDVAATATYTLVSGVGATDNAKFKISGNQLQTNQIFDFETQSTYSVRVRATSQTSFFVEKDFSISVNDVNEVPTITAIGNQNTCVGTDVKVIALSGITAGPETNQILTATISSDQAAFFDALNVTLLANQTGQISYKLKSNAIGSVNLSVVIKDDGGTANGGNDTHTEVFKLIINPFPVVSIISDKGETIDKGITVRLTANGGVSYQWEANEGIIGNTDQAELTVRPGKTTTYKVLATNAGGCTSVQEFTLTVNTNYDLVVAANLLSPNGDGLNDTWKIENIDLYPDNEVIIFDKSGRVIFSKKGYNNDWNGNINNSSLKEDTYYYLLDFGPGLPKKKGFITILNN